MKNNLIEIYRCPENKEILHLENAERNEKMEVVSGNLVSKSGRCYPIKDGIADFTYPSRLGSSGRQVRKTYDKMATEIYEDQVQWILEIFYQDEHSLRSKLIDHLEIDSDSIVLEIGCGTGRDTVLLQGRLKNGKLYSMDLSPEMLRICKKRIDWDCGCATDLFCGNASYLPFPDNVFDAVFHVGGINEFEEKKKALLEFSRVTKINGKVVIVDEGMAPWLKETEYARILTNSNPLLDHKPPLDLLPENATDVHLKWILGNAYYALDYRIGDTLPKVNMDLPHKGRRGGTLRTRWFGRLEGVTPETKALAERVVDKLDTSMHQWLEDLVREHAKRILDETERGNRKIKSSGLEKRIK